MSEIGYRTRKQVFTFGEAEQVSSNIIADSNGGDKPAIILAAHYDSTAAEQGSLGATDNGAGVAAMLAIAENLMQKLPSTYNVRFIAFGAEEVGLQGSRYYVQQLKERHPEQLKNIVAMINFDTIAGGDFVYVHSANTQPYDCADSNSIYNSESWVRDQLLKTSTKLLGAQDQYNIHPANNEFAEGVTGPWSDHAPFACQGIPVAYVESTNFTINGVDGYDGYSQSTHPALWDCFDSATLSACNRDKEEKWGNIWHTKHDKLSELEVLFPGRIQQQLEQNVKVLVEFLLTFQVPSN